MHVTVYSLGDSLLSYRIFIYWNATGGEYREDGKEVCSLMPCRRAVVLTIGVNKHHLRSDYELKKCVVSDPEATFTTWSEEYGSLIWQI
ncbi:uncharacterized protein LOC126585503 isoform X5 [Malus sylvestris]|uniref:uncharacterized protein LOC126585503 isoform X5 n=1 Tax=Malus sylvestris TaxID=3752 RepID=UPI0021ACB47B|nr:uncharacterized protein LOC126585503 isoform X5 [Malus sylvestris]